MDILIRAAAIAAVGAVLTLLLKKNSPEMALLLSIAAAVLTLTIASSAIKSVADFVVSLSDTAKLSSPVISAVLKSAGISIIARLASDVCRDAGQTAAASAVELCGVASAMYVALPLMETVLDAVEGML